MIQNLKAVLSALMLMILIFSIQGCNYSEGDDEAQASFDLMTTQEKAMHDKAMDTYGEKRLMSVREAVGKRGVRPDENKTPFIDVANVIKFCNENILIPTDVANSTDAQLKAKKANFSGQDFNWYKKIIKQATGEDLDEIQEETEKLAIKNFDSRVKLMAIIEEQVKEKERVVIDRGELLPLEQYRDVKQMARGCESAIAIVESAASQDRPLTHKDADDIQYEKSVCETKKLSDNL